MFMTIEYLQAGTSIQRAAFLAITRLGLMDTLADCEPVLCGTIPIGIDVDGSDLDVIMEVRDADRFQSIVRRQYGHLSGFETAKLEVSGVPTVTANFRYDGFAFELFGQPVPAKLQNAYRHMMIEHRLMADRPGLKETIVQLKRQGMKTEPAFALVLGLSGDPYDALLRYGEEAGFMEEEEERP
ncbi:DUF4269 domain-containing protein [Paenibacillus methanolicus]|uniref:Uncharacterized protein DUF4269 n=1 Tax=Paenibacillus methanolicus TaxID=582686 RepID=A0A5S5C1K8_9BACL|nr:DUF4269 domain-containing protein [Paenibacillus methanolicus]TYP72352.1 uncharacterized protein DUF4269 [Paenibacillus methanolicus]